MEQVKKSVVSLEETQSVVSLEETLKCTNCQQYLSVPPIYVNTGGYWCGRCKAILFGKLDSFGDTYHLAAYEIVAKTVQFSCQFDVFGCKEMLDFENVKIHEMFCKFKSEKCPSIYCQIKIHPDQLLDHYRDHHKELIVDPGEIPITVKENFVQHYVIVLSSKAYVLSVSTFSKRKTIHLGLYKFDNCDITKTVNYLLEIRSNATKSLIVIEETIQKFNSEKNFANARVLNYSDLQRSLKGDLFFSIRLAGLEVMNKPSREVLEELECVVCKDYMKAPIYICTTGHSICSKCKMRVVQCPICKAFFGGARNFALERLSEKTEAARGEEESPNAIQAMLKCPLEIPQQCRWIGPAENICAHSRGNHKSHTFCGTTTLRRDLKAATSAENYVVFYDQNTFKVFVKYHENGLFWCSVFHNDLPSMEAPRYRFLIHFKDQKDYRRLTISNVCYSIQKCTQTHKDAISFIAIELPYDYLPSYADKNQFLTFSIEIKPIGTV